MTAQGILLHLEAYVLLAGTALTIACALGVPLGIAAARTRVRSALLGLASIGRVVPSLAVLTFMLPLLGVGFAPALAALVLLATAPVLLGTELALRTLPIAVLDAADGLGMSRRQRLRRVELPLALPLIFSSVRTATTEVIASAVLASFIGAGGLGEYITTGLQADDAARLWTGVAMIAALALGAEILLARVGRRFRAAS